MMDADVLSQAIASDWDSIVQSLGDQREQFEYQLTPLLRQLEFKGPDIAAVIKAIFTLFDPFYQAHTVLLQAIRRTQPSTAKSGALIAGQVNKNRYTVVPVLFATNRASVLGDAGLVSFGPGRGDLSYGVADVSIPDDHRMGRVERPRWWRLQFREDPAQHIVIQSLRILPSTQFAASASATLGGSRKKEILLFVHGYNVGFREAVANTAQIAYDLQFEGLSVLYSWPSEGSIMMYTVDEANVTWSQPHFAQFLRLLREDLGAQTVHIVAHSMGNRLVAETLAALSPEAANRKGQMRQIIFAAPDIDAATFKDLCAAFAGKAERFTLYASSEDKALKASKVIHRYPRAGDAGLDLTIARPLDTVDATAVDTSLVGHSYYGECRSVLADMFSLIREGAPPESRFGLVPKERYGSRYWLFGA
jgi:esterase/lipase superfamily enzyme